MPPPGQSCANCRFYVAPQCRFDKPSFASPMWVNVEATDWCGMWVDATSGAEGLNDYDTGAGYRGTSDTGDAVSLTADWTLLTPSFASITNSRNFTLQSSGVMQLDITTGAVSPTMEFYVHVNAIVAFRADTNSETIELTIGQNGTPDLSYLVPFGLRTAGMIGPIPAVAGLSMKNGDTVAFYARDRTITSATYTAYHMLLESFKVITT